MASIKTKQKWIRTGVTFNAAARYCDEDTLLKKHEREVIVDYYDNEGELWATLERLILKKPSGKDVIFNQ